LRIPISYARCGGFEREGQLAGNEVPGEALRAVPFVHARLRKACKKLRVINDALRISAAAPAVLMRIKVRRDRPRRSA